MALKKHRSENKSLDKKLKVELELSYGKYYLCSLLLFYCKRVSTTLYFVLDCCLSNQSDVILSKRKEEGKNFVCSIPNVRLKSHQRIKVRPAACIGLKPGQGSHFWFCFMSTSDKNNLQFNVEINRRMGGCPNAILGISTESRNNIEICKMEFNLDSLMFAKESTQRKTRVTVRVSSYEPPENEIQPEVTESVQNEEPEVLETSRNENLDDLVMDVRASPTPRGRQLSDLTFERYEQ